MLWLQTLCALLLVGYATAWPRSKASSRNAQVKRAAPLAHKEYYIDTPIDHFPTNPSENVGSFKLRYFFSDKYFDRAKPGPIYLFDGAEVDAEVMIDYLDYSWMMDAAKLTGGMVVILEQRYYGKSQPFSDYSTDSMRFSSTLQSIEDAKHFATFATYAGYENLDLTYKNAMIIYVGVSYGGAKAAIARNKYGDIFAGAVAVSAVTESFLNYWQFYGAVIEHGIRDCVRATQVSMLVMDLLVDQGNLAHIEAIKDGFGMTGVHHIEDVLYNINSGTEAFTDSIWKQNGGLQPDYAAFCANITAPLNAHAGYSTADLTSAVDLVQASGFMSDRHRQGETLIQAATWLINWMTWFKPTGESWRGYTTTADENWTTYNATGYAIADLTQTWKPWYYLMCTEWPNFRSGFGRPESAGLPVVSRHLNMAFMHKGCPWAFPPGKLNSIPIWPDTAGTNKLGGWGIAADRLAYVCGKKDPWLQATPCADLAPPRKSTVQQPFIVIDDIGHNGALSVVTPSNIGLVMPESVKGAQTELTMAVSDWFSHWTKPV
ncbi:uncharacterized protein L969DRAFT_78907 [Mixia osmundae IAM 14324]|uniref:Uncharacterized protein n=1 Tax=Mixia osmundae (strain CBS 9802 / IAM 14324 / JCM 22182 / KY 12970) TaxID=764103 RepID=G7DSW1_MIXOS|nr:uncharacterized protein L969DRAFT_78907 [Mixia osmundae IAM 14324]KEI37127.1 hypothetical protein L969DRAFT_78907 [Mixia osmundae IAM 14324]GAA93671.1 hypothetical protein E5Q_00316 [Mixia osmundae IAM 14324]